MFKCPFKQCVYNFTKRVVLCEYLKIHEGEAYWKKLNNTSSINRVVKNSTIRE